MAKRCMVGSLVRQQMDSSKCGTLGQKSVSQHSMDTTIRYGAMIRVLLLTSAWQQVWALTVSRDNKTIVSGAADSVVTFSEDCSEEQDAARESARAELVLKYVMSSLVMSLSLKRVVGNKTS